MTWKVRGRSSSHTPEPASTPMPSATTSLHHRLPAASERVGSAPRLASARRRGGAHRLVRQRDQDQHRGADHQRKTPRSKKSALGRGTSPRSGRSTYAMWEVRKGWPNSQAPSPVAGASSRPTPIQRTGRIRAVLHPARAAGHVLQDEGDGHGDAGDEAAARLVVAAQEQIDGRRADHREQQPHDQRRDQHGSRRAVSPCCRAGRARRSAFWARCCSGTAMLSGAGRKRRSSA